MASRHPMALSPEHLRWHFDASTLGFETTREIDPVADAISQTTAAEALRFGLECDAPGQNIYVRGTRGTGRLRMVHRLLNAFAPQATGKQDRCYVHNFSRPDRPRLITLPAGEARRFRRRMTELAEYIRDDLIKALEGEPYDSTRRAVQERGQQTIKDITAPLEQDLQQAGMALVSTQQGAASQTVILPLVEGQPVPPQQLRQLVAQGQVSAERLQQFEELYPDFQKRLQDIGRQVNDATRAGGQEVQALNERSTKELLSGWTQDILKAFPYDSVHQFMDEITTDIIDNRLRPGAEPSDPCEIYGVNIVIEHTDYTQRPIVEENAPTVINLLGSVEPKWNANGQPSSDYRGVHAGAILRADQGYLILNVNDLLSEPGAWRAMMRTLRTGRLEIVPPEGHAMRPVIVIQPEPIEVHVRVILIGDAPTYYRLDQLDPDFRELFKVLADLDSELDRSVESVQQYAVSVANLTNTESVLPFHRTAIAALADHGARIAARAGKITARFGRIADIAREASFIASQDQVESVYDHHVKQAVTRTKERASQPSRRFQQMISSGTIMIKTRGAIVGQINGLAVIHSGQLTYGFPSRITATIGPGSAGLINIEGQAQMSGSIHTKGFHILGGLLRHLLQTTHPLAFSGSIAFEQSYGGIDGDSASGAEICCLLSALTGIPLKQSFSMTGAIDQLGHLEAIGGVNEKIEGFFDVCDYFGLTGEQGVIIPQSNAGDLMLRENVVEAAARGEFHIYAVETIHEALEILTGIPAGERIDGEYPEGSLLRHAVDRADEFWRQTLRSPKQLTEVEEVAADEILFHPESEA
ncbi:ATP-dependent protease [Candidatus Entotheonella serta]|nr:ATP-dependent protease [Candidatus Entotheonella serta]